MNRKTPENLITGVAASGVICANGIGNSLFALAGIIGRDSAEVKTT